MGGGNDKKKIVFVDYSFHKKTKSSDFFKEILKKEFELINLIADNSNTDDINKHDSFAVIFWQQIPRVSVLNKIKCRNIIFVPMYDDVYRPGYFEFYKSIDPKIICFSRKLYDHFRKEGFKCIYLRYFPKPRDYKKNDGGLNVFFWQRVNEIDWNVVKKLIGSDKINKVYFKKDIDPGYNPYLPDEEDEKKFNIKYLEGWVDRERYIDALKECNVFIAPRLKEGIGHAYLEAMAYGLCVIANNDSTHNEYIKSGENGVLFDVNDPKEIDLNKANEYGRNASEFISQGYERWLKEKEKINEFVEGVID